MLGVIRPNTYHASMRPLQSEFYDFCEREDEMAAPLIAKSIRKLLQKAPSLLAKRYQMNASNFNPTNNSKWPLQLIAKDNEDRLFHSDSSLSSNCSSLSSDSCASSSFSNFSSQGSLSESNGKQKKKNKIDVVLPTDMMTRLVRDIVRMAEGEAYGIKGCQLQIELKDSESEVEVNVGKINCDPKIKPKCFLLIRLVSIPPPTEAPGSQVLLNRLLGTSTHSIYIKAGYTIEKRKN